MARLTELKETHLSQDSADRGQWVITTDDPYWQRRLERITKPHRLMGESREYRLRADQLLFRKGKPQLDRAQCEQRARNLKRGGKSPDAIGGFVPQMGEADSLYGVGVQ